MEQGNLDASLVEEIRTCVFGTGFMKLVQTLRRNGKSFRISLRPVLIRGEKRFQAEMVDEGHVQVKNFDSDGAAEGLREILTQPGARDLHVMSATGDVHVRVTRKGHVLVSHSAPLARTVEVQGHDHVKKVPLTSFDASSLLRVTQLSDGSGQIRASMRGKYDQVNEFLRLVGELLGSERPNTFTLVDCGCGKAYLTFALYFYLTQSLHFPSVRIIGVDRRADVIEAAQKMATQLDVSETVQFVQADLTTFDLSTQLSPREGEKTPRVDLVVSLHACDTATDEALARAVEWRAHYIASAPCCQHELQKVISPTSSVPFTGVLRQGILRERLCDILTDSFRAMILRILGFRTHVVEFVSPDATARNILLKAEYGVKPGQGGAVSDYLNLREFWHVTPWLETRLSALLAKYLTRYE